MCSYIKANYNTFYSSTWEAERQVNLWSLEQVLGQPGLNRKSLSEQNKGKTKQKKNTTELRNNEKFIVYPLFKSFLFALHFIEDRVLTL